MRIDNIIIMHLDKNLFGFFEEILPNVGNFLENYNNRARVGMNYLFMNKLVGGILGHFS